MDQVESISSIYPKIFVICNQPDTAPVWGYILRKDGMVVILEKSIEKALDHWSIEIPELTVIDLDVTRQDPVEFCKTVRAVSVAPILLLLPAYNEKQVLDAYQCGADDVVIKPVSPPVFLAKIKAWLKRSWTVPVGGLGQIKVGRYQLNGSKRCLVDAEEAEIKLTNLEFRLLHLLMSQPGKIFSADDLIESIWGAYGSGDHMLLKNVVYRLRKKIESDHSSPAFLQTGPGGYLFQG
jgi:two-component system, OmpR family, response regulator VicR